MRYLAGAGSFAFPSNYLIILAPRSGFEPATNRLTTLSPLPAAPFCPRTRNFRLAPARAHTCLIFLAPPLYRSGMRGVSIPMRRCNFGVMAGNATTPPDPTRGPADEGKPPTFSNVETHWWDASQIYGSSDETVARVRRNPATGEPAADGKIHLGPNGLLPRETATVYGETGEIEFTGVNGNWWIGLSALHALFAREHNLICDRLKIDYPDKDGDWLFEKARLILAALIAKIHTVEWTRRCSTRRRYGSACAGTGGASSARSSRALTAGSATAKW